MWLQKAQEAIQKVADKESYLVFYSKGKNDLAVQCLLLLLFSLQHLIEKSIFARKYWTPFPLQNYLGYLDNFSKLPRLSGSENPARALPSTFKLNYNLQSKQHVIK